MDDYLTQDLEDRFPLIRGRIKNIADGRTGEILISLLDDDVIYSYNLFDHIMRPLPPNADNMTDEEMKEDFASRLRLMMYWHGFNQIRLSEVTGISTVTMNYYTTGKRLPGFANLDKLVRAIGCSVDDLRYF